MKNKDRMQFNLKNWRKLNWSLWNKEDENKASFEKIGKIEKEQFKFPQFIFANAKAYLQAHGFDEVQEILRHQMESRFGPQYMRILYS